MESGYAVNAPKSSHGLSLETRKPLHVSLQTVLLVLTAARHKAKEVVNRVIAKSEQMQLVTDACYIDPSAP